MGRYSTLEISFNGKHYVFVTRGRSKPIDPEEALMYLSNEAPGGSVDEDNAGQPEGVVDGGSQWRIPDDKARRHLFRKDLQMGMEFCMEKYGQPEEAIRAEADRLARGEF